jgi:hypothetical protein
LYSSKFGKDDKERLGGIRFQLKDRKNGYRTKCCAKDTNKIWWNGHRGKNERTWPKEKTQWTSPARHSSRRKNRVVRKKP